MCESERVKERESETTEHPSLVREYIPGSPGNIHRHTHTHTHKRTLTHTFTFTHTPYSPSSSLCVERDIILFKLEEAVIRVVEEQVHVALVAVRAAPAETGGERTSVGAGAGPIP